MKHRVIPITGLWFILLAATGSSLCAADETLLSVADLNAAKAKWNDWLDQPIRVEGRVSTVTRSQFRLVHCDVTFRVTEEQSRTVGKVRNVEILGRFKREKETDKLYVAVERVEIALSDLEYFDAREAKLKSSKSADWYDLAIWAEQRGKFYSDDDLATRSVRTWRKGFELERTELAENDFEARFALAAKLKTRELDPSLQEELQHEGARLKWQQSQNDRQQIAKFADWLTELYPQSTKPLKTWPEKLSREYEANPLRTFRESPATDRGTIARLFLIQVELARVLPLAKLDGSNATTIVDALKERVPERTDLIEKYAESAFQQRLKTIATATRQDALRLAEELKTRDRTADATALLRSWMSAQEPRLRKDGPIGLMQLAEDYLRLINDEPAAVTLLAEANKLDASFEDAGERLKQLGYHLVDQRWVKGDSAAVTDMPQNNKPPNQLAVGMKPEDVLALLGSPNAKSRIISANGVYEVWSFGRRGTSRLLIHLQRSAADESAKVTRFLTEN